MKKTLSLLVFLSLFLTGFAQTGLMLPTTGAATPGRITLGTTGAASAGRLSLPRSGTVVSVTVASGSVTDPFQFALASPSMTSAGVFKSDGTLVRTLWSNESLPSGAHTRQWDQKDDAGTTVSTLTGLTVKVLKNNVSTYWEGVLANTSTYMAATSTWEGLDHIRGIALTSTYGYVAMGDNEQQAAGRKFAIGTPQEKIDILPKSATYHYHVATDGTKVYWGAWDHVAQKSLIHATKCSDDTDYSFTSSTASTSFVSRFSWYTYPSVIELQSSSAYSISGLAVSSNYLFVAYSASNTVKAINKTTGDVLGTLSITAPVGLACDGNGDVWVTSGTNLSRYTFTGSTFSSAQNTVTVTAPLHLIANGSNVGVFQGGASQQVAEYTLTGTFVRNNGQANGYNTNALAANDKFCFRYLHAHENYAYGAYGSSGDIWIGDIGDQRVQHFNSSRSFVESIQFLKFNYLTQVCGNDATRTFAAYLEFDVDYSKANIRTAGSWVFKANWGATLSQNDTPDGTSQFVNIRSPVTLSNGRTYGLCLIGSSDSLKVVELVNGGTIRNCGLPAINWSNKNARLYDNGDIYRQGSYTNGQPVAFYRMARTGFDGSNNPTYSAESQVDSSPNFDDNQPLSGFDNNPYEIASNGAHIVFRPERKDASTGDDFHLGAFNPNTGSWLWRTFRGTLRSNISPYPTDFFDNGNGVNIAGSDMQVLGPIMVAGYHGEFWKQSQTAMWHLFHQSGLNVLTFGAIGFDGRNYLEVFSDSSGMAGNALKFKLVAHPTDSDVAYLYFGDESVSGGIHRTKVSGLSSIGFVTVAHSPSYTLSDRGTNLMAGLTIGTTLTSTSNNGWTRTGTESTSDLSNYYSAKAGQVGYRINSLDVTMATAKPSGPETVDRTLTGTVNTSWTLKGYLAFGDEGGRNVVNLNSNGMYFRILDNTGKIILQMEYYGLDQRGATLSNPALFVNDTKVIQMYYKSLRRIIMRKTPVTITGTGSGISVNYGGYIFSGAVYESGANWQQPAKMQLYYFGDGSSAYGRQISVQEMYFKTN